MATTKSLLLIYSDGRVKPVWTPPRNYGERYLEREFKPIPHQSIYVKPEDAVKIDYIERQFVFLGETEAYMVYQEWL